MTKTKKDEDYMPREDENILFFSFRYALGRRTAAVSILVTAIKNKWSTITLHTKEQIKREILEAIVSERAGDTCDIEKWCEIFELGPEAQEISFEIIKEKQKIKNRKMGISR